MLQLITDHNPSNADNTIIRDGIIGFNERKLSAENKAFSIFLKDADGKIHGGILTWLDIESVYIDILWIKESWRGKDYGTKLILAAEAEGVKHGCRYCTVDTFDFQAEEFYLKNGYERMGEIKNYIREHSRIFLRKKIV